MPVFYGSELIYDLFVFKTGVDAASAVVSQYVRVVETKNWFTREIPHCPVCLLELGPNSPGVVVSLIKCEHYLHLDCLNGKISYGSCIVSKTSKQ